MKKILILSLLFISGWMSAQAVDLNKENRDPEYVKSIVSRSQKIVDKLGLTDAKTAEDVRNVIANRYFELNDIYEVRDAKVKKVKESGLTGEAKNEALKAAEDEKDAALYRSHFAFPANLSLFLDEKQIEADRKHINNTRKIKHDMKNHMYAINNMAKNNMSKDIITYTNDILGKIEGEKVYINTGNYLIDGILNVKFEEIKNQGIDFKYDVKIPEGIKLPEFEVITILGNLLDNAIEGVKSIKDNRYIEVFISYKDSNLLIKIVNTFDGLVIKDNKGFVSRKEEKAYHGIGLENVREQVEKSNGYMNIDTGNCMFTVDLFINL